MLSVVFGLSVFTAICLATRNLRLYGAIGLALIAMIIPVVTLALAVVAVVAWVGLILFRTRH
jgi:hypothetical protein